MVCSTSRSKLSALVNQVVGCRITTSGIRAQVREGLWLLGSILKGFLLFILLVGAGVIFCLGYQVIDNNYSWCSGLWTSRSRGFRQVKGSLGLRLSGFATRCRRLKGLLAFDS